MASVPGYVYAQRNDAIWVNLYVANNADIKLDNGRTRPDDAGDALPLGRRRQDDRQSRSDRRPDDTRAHSRMGAQ